MKKLLFLCSLIALVSLSCKKVKTPEENLADVIAKVKANDAVQLAADVEKIKKYITDNKLTASSTPEDIYYVTEDAGLGVAYPTLTSSVSARYKGYLLDGTVFDDSKGAAISFGLQQVIVGWTIGMQKFKKRSKGKLLIPSPYAYGGAARSTIPANSVLIFDIELVDFN